MRLWTLHPCYLDAKGLVALWREGLLAKAVLEDRTRGYRNHPQLTRFREHHQPREFLCEYLRYVYIEAQQRAYRFDEAKLPSQSMVFEPVEESEGQLLYERTHLLRKLNERDHERFRILSGIASPRPHPLFRIVPGEIQPWEKSLEEQRK